MNENVKKRDNVHIALSSETKSQSKTYAFTKLDVNSMAKGIGRKATFEELTDYLERNADAKSIDINQAFKKFKITLNKQ